MNRVEQGVSGGMASRWDEVTIPAEVISRVCQGQPWLRLLCVVEAGSGSLLKGILPRRSKSQGILIHCARGSGWCKCEGRRYALKAGDAVLLYSDSAVACEARSASGWSLNWALATGSLVSELMNAWCPDGTGPVRHAGNDLQLGRLFGEILGTLKQGISFPGLFRASTTLAHLLSVMVQAGHAEEVDIPVVGRKIAETIIYMTDHLQEPLRVSLLARMANLSCGYYAELFKEQTGCSPREYLHLLRIHRACQLLKGSALSVKAVASQLGYRDPFHFSRQFKAFQGMSPSEFRRNLG